MNYCPFCGKELSMFGDTCPNCGQNIKDAKFAMSTNKTSIHENIPNGMTFLCAFIGLCLPIVGLIIYFLLRKTNIKNARAALIGFAIRMIFALFIIIFEVYING